MVTPVKLLPAEEEIATSWFRRFSRTFWVGNTLELFERLAFYGQSSYLAVYLAEQVGLGGKGLRLAGLFFGALYSLPILAGPLVDRFGFRRCLMTCFAAFSMGYLSIALAGMKAGQGLIQAFGAMPYVTFALLFTAVGGSLIKPCIVGTVASTTNHRTKALGYSIYYTLVNLGGALGPELALRVQERWGIQYVLVASSLTSVALLLGTLFFFKEPGRVVRPGDPPPKTMGQVLHDLLVVLRNQRFLLFLVIFSGFWIMFWQIFLSLPFYVRDVMHYQRYARVQEVDSWAIICLQVLVTTVTRRFRPILAMSAGIGVASASWLLIPMSGSPWMAVLALIVFAIGETMQAPRYYEYVAELAPPGQVGMYMGFAFLPVAIGAYVGGPLSEYLISHYMRGPSPASMWAAVSTIGFASTVLLVIYDRVLHRDRH